MTTRNKMHELGQRLSLALDQSMGVRLGESTVVSQRVHVVSPQKPEEIKIIRDDAGQVFYGRRKRGTIYHIDVFHQVGQVDHRMVAQALRQTLNQELGLASQQLLDLIDIQTATGGGRVTGSLNFGRKASLRRAHANHVHLAAELNPAQLSLLVPIVATVEAEVLRQGLEIRKVEKVTLDLLEKAGSPTDLSAYTSESDSLLREKETSQDTKANVFQSNMEEAQQLVAKTLPPKELLHLLNLFPLEPGPEHRRRWGDLDHTLETLKSKGFVDRRRGSWSLTRKGLALQNFINLHLPELESKMRQFLRRIPTAGGAARSSSPHKQEIGLKYQRDKRELSSNSGGQVNLPATVSQAACRWIRGLSPSGCILKEDLRYAQPLRHQRYNIVLLLDTSASMAGDRLRAARLLAQHLVLATRDKVAVISFQDETVLVPSAFSKSLSKMQAQLLSLRATGLTPLAHALDGAIKFLQRHRVRKPLVVLITDGIPTVSLKGGDPSADALFQAAKLKSLPLEFVCIGLDPNQSFLEELCRASGGRLYVVKELEPGVLARLVHQELDGRRAN